MTCQACSKQLRAALAGGRGQVVQQRVEPHIRNVVAVPRQLDAPGHARFGPRDAQVANRLLQHFEHLVAVAARLDEVWVLLQVFQQPRLILLHAEKIIGLAAQFRGRTVARIDAVDQFLLGHVALGSHAVQALVLGVVDVARRMDARQHILHVVAVARLGGADEVVVADLQPVPQPLEGVQAQVVHEALRRLARLGRRLGDLLAVFVGAGHEIHRIPGEAVIAGERVGQNLLENVADMRRTVGVVDGGGDVKGWLGAQGLGHSGQSSGICRVRIAAGALEGQKKERHHSARTLACAQASGGIRIGVVGAGRMG